MVTVQPGESIQEAIAQIQEGGVVCLGEGIWEENLVIGKSLTLRGAGLENSIIKGKEWGKPVILIESEEEIEVLIDGLTIAETKIENGIRIAGKAKVTILNSQISKNGLGILMGGLSQAVISGSKISGNSWDGIKMEDSSRAVISGSKISENGWNGIRMGDLSRAEISDSQISGNDENGIWMGGSSQAEIRGNSFLNNRGCGIYVESGEATVSGGPNDMEGNGADLCGYAPAYLRRPLVPQTERTQLFVPGDYPTLQEAIDAIAPGGTIEVAPGTYRAGLTIWKPLTLRGAGEDETVIKPLKPTRKVIVSIISEAEGVHLEGLAITESKDDGLVVYGKASLKDLKISENGWNGIKMGGSSRAVISGSKISENDWNGIWMGDLSRAEISDSQISGNDENGILMGGSPQAEIRESRFLDNRGCGIWVQSGKATISGGPNDMEGNGADLCGYAPAYLRQPLVPQTERTRLFVPGDYSTLQEAIDAIAPGGTINVAPGTYRAGLTIWKPLVLRGAGEDETVIKPLEPTHKVIVSIISEVEGVHLEGLAITESKDDGLVVYGKASLKDLKISRNNHGILIGGSSQATISGSKISENDGSGIWIDNLSRAEISNSQISGSAIGIGMSGLSRAVISGSKISGNGLNGIEICNSSQATIRDNEIFYNGYGVALFQRPCHNTDAKFNGKVEGSGNEIHDNSINVCPSELEFLMTKEGGCYGPLCE